MTAATPAPPGATDARRSSQPTVGKGWIIVGATTVAALVPLAFLGPGTDLDVGAVLHSGLGIMDGSYTPSRNPGAPVHEAAVGVLHHLLGTVGPNLGSLAAATALTVLLALLLRHEGVGRVGLSVAVVVSNPWFLASATSTVDFLWALAFWVGAALVLRTRPTLGGAAAAGVLAGLAIGCRASTAALVGGLALAEALDRPSPETEADAPLGAPTAPVRALVLAVAAAGVGTLLFIPAFLSAGGSLAFAQNDVPTSSPLVQLGRFLAKDLYFVGPFAAVVLLLCAPALARTLLRWRGDWLVRLGFLTVVISQLLFLRFPWKMGHLLPALVGLALLLARALGDRAGAGRRPSPRGTRLLAALVAAQLLYAAVNVQLVTPDHPNAATGGRLTFAPGWGALVIDVRCRADDPRAWEGPGIDRLHAVWDCAKPWSG